MEGNVVQLLRRPVNRLRFPVGSSSFVWMILLHSPVTRLWSHLSSWITSFADRGHVGQIGQQLYKCGGCESFILKYRFLPRGATGDWKLLLHDARRWTHRRQVTRRIHSCGLLFVDLCFHLIRLHLCFCGKYPGHDIYLRTEISIYPNPNPQD